MSNRIEVLPVSHANEAFPLKNIGTHSVRELFCSCQEEVQKWLLNERACTKVHYWDVVYLSSVENSKSIGF